MCQILLDICTCADTYTDTCNHASLSHVNNTCNNKCVLGIENAEITCYGVATISRLLQIIGLCCRI